MTRASPAPYASMGKFVSDSQTRFSSERSMISTDVSPSFAPVATNILVKLSVSNKFNEYLNKSGIMIASLIPVFYCHLSLVW